jgi:hypothetical protein
MGYYTYPQAGYYGDPGFFSGLGRVFKGIGKVAGGLLGIGGGGKAAKPVAITPPPSLPGVGMVKLPKKISSVVGKIPKGVIPAIGGGIIGAAAGGGAATLMHPGAVRRRRMRVTNVKALRRSIRRCQGFAKLAKRVLRFTSPRPPRGRPVFRHRKRKSI